MAIELIAALAAAAALAGIAHLLRRLSGGRLPRWLVPVAAGLGLIGFTVWSEYDWFDRVSAELPEGVPVVSVTREPSPLRPWTYAAPLVTGFVALDARSLGRHPARAELVMAKVYGFARWRPVQEGLMVIDCSSARRVLLTEGVAISDAGELTGGAWVAGQAGDDFTRAACQGG
jgi:hypothetical protein